MTKYKFSKRSLSNIEGIDFRLIILLGLMLDYSPYDFVVTEGVRTEERQKQLVAEGKSKTMKSKHLTGSAFDIAIIDENGQVTWDIKYYREFADVIMQLAHRLGFNIECGAYWENFIDEPHVQIND